MYKHVHQINLERFKSIKPCRRCGSTPVIVQEVTEYDNDSYICCPHSCLADSENGNCNYSDSIKIHSYNGGMIEAINEWNRLQNTNEDYQPKAKELKAVNWESCHNCRFSRVCKMTMKDREEQKNWICADYAHE